MFNVEFPASGSQCVLFLCFCVCASVYLNIYIYIYIYMRVCVCLCVCVCACVYLLWVFSVQYSPSQGLLFNLQCSPSNKECSLNNPWRPTFNDHYSESRLQNPSPNWTVPSQEQIIDALINCNLGILARHPLSTRLRHNKI